MGPRITTQFELLANEMKRQDAARAELFRNIRHLCNTCQPPKHLTIEMLTSILETLRGTTSLVDKGE